MLDIEKIKQDFPILSRKVNGKPLVYLDNAATSQKPNQVINALSAYYREHNANVHRGIHTLGDESTRLYAQARETVAQFIGAQDASEIVFVRNTTEAINLVAYAWGRATVKQGDVILVTEMEHHSNIVPWQELARQVGARVEFIRVDLQTGEIDLADYAQKLTLKPKLVSVVHVSNFLGTVNPVGEMARLAHKVGAKVLVDGAQSVPHMQVRVRDLGVDFYAFSGHKMMGPMGIGVLWGKREILEAMGPFLSGGGMISEVSTNKTTFTDLPERFEAGTPNVAGAVGLMAAVRYLEALGMRGVREHEKAVTTYALEQLGNKELGVEVFGPNDPEKRGGVVAFTLDGVHAHDVAQILDREMGVAVRSGHHCTMPMHTKLKLPATTRASFYVYNSESDVDDLIEGLYKVRQIFKK